MLLRIGLRAMIVMVAGFLGAANPAEAQIWDKAKEAVGDAAEGEVLRKADEVARNAVRCTLGDAACVEKAEADGEQVVFTDEHGNVIRDADGQPISDPEAAAAAAQRPGEGVWANYDFVPGERVLFYEDYSNDNVGDFPRRLEFVNGNWEVVEWQNRRFLRNTSRGGFKIPLPEGLPERFTVEFPVHFTGRVNVDLALATTTPEGNNLHSLTDNWIAVHYGAVGLVNAGGPELPEATGEAPEILETVVPIRVMADGSYVKVYVGERRVANVPNAQLERGSELFFQNPGWADQENAILIGPIRVAAGGADLYSTLESEGEVSTRGILFAVNSDRIRPESTPTLGEIGRMLEQHVDLRLEIQGHTDSDGDEVHNQELSERRAAAVKEYLVQKHGIDPSRLEPKGLGEGQPAADNSTPEGKQQNRRVVLVKL